VSADTQRIATPSELPTPLARIRDVASAPREPVRLDETDLALLKILVTDCRASQRQIAISLGVSPPTVGERMARLESAGVINGYRASIDWAAVGYGQVVIMTVEAATGHDVSEMMAALWELPEVEAVTLVTGDLDLMVTLRVRDHAHLRMLLMEEVWQIPGMQKTATLLSVADMPEKNVGLARLEKLDDADLRTRRHAV
jgi:DNA-binding Lrp family transcriptional regulator